ncbi:TniQ family protein [Paenirhodobacter populi]|uniref:TniQ domain-containing protein n=1 Tax=Paenirhodobacter populi TaxID=2306993 RepID=A0A443IIM8_9RHOB|nr:TniQ family protein [Sinirhodobacter populi]RWR04066.1 hypothetical protein D2T33_21400 [Sinirhodobacter populi]
MKNTPASQFLTLSALLRDSYAPRSEGRFSFRGHLLDRPMVNRREIRLCPHCILEDHDREGALGRYGRSYWQLTQFRTCPRHGTPITSLPAQRHALDFAPVVERSLESIRQNAGAATVRQHGFESWLLHRLAGQRTDYWFDDLEISVVAQFCEKVGIALCFGGATAPGQLEDGQLAIATETAFQRLAARTTGVEPLFREIWTKSCSTRAGYYATFGHLWRWLDKVKADPRYERILSKAADFVFSHQPIPAGTLLLGRECKQRRCHSVNSAAAVISPT